MGTMTFNLPPDLPLDAQEELERSSVAGGQDNMPYPTQAFVEDGQMVLSRQVDESGSLQAPWIVEDFGLLMTGSATLMERLLPYSLPVELARGKVNQVRCQTADWLMGGLIMPDSLEGEIRDAYHAFSHAISSSSAAEAIPHANVAMKHAHFAAQHLVQVYMNQVFQVRHTRQPHLDTQFGCRLQSREPTGAGAKAYLDAFNTVHLPLAWRDIQPEPDRYCWEQQDRMVEWAISRGLKVVAGPLVDFSGRTLPDWIWEKESELLSLSGMVCEHLERVIKRYQSHIRTWQVTAGSNCAGVLAMRDEELIWLTVRLAETVKKVNAQLETVVGVAQPWGDYLAEQERTQSPFLFADTLLRTGVKPAALDLEIVMGVAPRGNYCRDLLDFSRLLDLYALLGVPLQVTLGYPSSRAADLNADPDLRVNAGYWKDGFSPSSQADWAASFASLALCKPYVRSVVWSHFTDAEPHHFPNCGLLDVDNQPKPALDPLTQLRQVHLK
jgi:hypothetical protein